ncbi:response regulator transcription factor [Patescibacteria group bacterium]
MKLLVVEDDKKIANALKKGLEHKSHVVDVAYDGISGNDFALSENYDVIILDLMLPDIDGMTICGNIRHEGITTPVLMLTAKDHVDDVVEGLNTGADDYLTKPFEFEELVARIQALSRRPERLIKDILECCEIYVDLIKKEVKVEDKKIDLTKKEFALLEYLIKNKERVVTKEEIIEHVWSFDTEILENTVEVYIAYLRNKIDKPFNTHYIKTVRGFGYRISEK